MLWELGDFIFYFLDFFVVVYYRGFSFVCFGEGQRLFKRTIIRSRGCEVTRGCDAVTGVFSVDRHAT